MPHITRALLRKRAEHNEGLLTSLEELTLHQEELEGINDVLGRTCRELKILYLQNNLLPRLEQLHHLKRLEYLNVALNNICVVEGLGSCEFLRKLDLTVNFIDFDALEASISHLVGLKHLRDLYFLGNPVQAKAWFEEEEEEEGREKGEEGEDEEEEKKQAFFYYVVHRLPQLQFLDGHEITRSTRLVAARHFPRLEARLRVLAVRTRREKEEKAGAKRREKESNSSITTPIDEDETRMNLLTTHDPETRREIYLELAAQKQAKEKRQKALVPRERDAEQEQAQRVAKLHAEEGERGKEEEDENKKVRQKNEGKWPYTLQDEDDPSSSNSTSSSDSTTHPGCITLNLVLPRHLDSSLIDVDVHPTHINTVVKGKLLRLLLPKEVRVEESKAKRSKTTGDLCVVMPKVEGVTTRRGRYTGTAAAAAASSSSSSSSSLSARPIDLSSSSSGRGSSSSSSSSSSRRMRDMPRITLAEEMLAAREGCCERTCSSSPSSSSLPSSSSSSSLRPLRQAVDVRNIVTRKKEEEEGEEGEEGREDRRVLLTEVASVRLHKNGEREKEEEEEEGREGGRTSPESSAAQETEKDEGEQHEWDESDIPPLV